ncbi:hypothetical protein QUF72_08040 [Desulfobacterales bacterium HSG2]|nr:hypothetical protein [Desulfobacterales bacterium HSG2]
MRYITTAERIGEEKGIEKGTLIAQILIAQRLAGQTEFFKEQLRGKSLEDLKRIFAELIQTSGESAEFIKI